MVSQKEDISNQNYAEIFEELEKIYKLRALLPLIQQKQFLKQRYIS